MRRVVLMLAAIGCAHTQRSQPEAVAPPAAVQKPDVAQKPAAPPPRLIEVPPAIAWKEARELMARGEWEAASVKLRSVLTRDPANAGAQFDAGVVAERRGDPAAAQEAYRRTLTLDASHAAAALNLARLLRDRPADAEPFLRGALAKHPADPALLNELAASLRAQKKLDEAQDAVRRILQRHPKDADAYRNLAAIEADRGHLRLAESALQSARKLDPKDATLLNALGLLAMRRDDVSAARSWFEEATKLDPALAAAWANLGAIALEYRDYAAAEEAYRKAVALDGARWQTRLARAWALEGLRRFGDARGEYEQVLSVRPKDEDALYGRAVALKAGNDLPAALEAFKAYLALGKPAKAKEAEAQIAAIDLRLKSSTPPAKPAVKAQAGAGDLSQLPQDPADADGQPSAAAPAVQEPPAAAQAGPDPRAAVVR